MTQTAKAYVMLEGVLNDEGAFISPAELHGWLVGRLCVAGGGDAKQSVAMILDQFSLEPTEGLLKTLNALIELARSQLGNVEMNFMLMLPGEDAGLVNRGVALSHWCDGFLSSYALSGGDAKDEFLADLVEITRLDSSESQEDVDELAFQEVSEYVRLGVISLYLDGKQDKVQ
jgi:uncharacterized protein YgfB (UPF0149 family)